MTLKQVNGSFENFADKTGNRETRIFRMDDLADVPEPYSDASLLDTVGPGFEPGFEVDSRTYTELEEKEEGKPQIFELTVNAVDVEGFGGGIVTALDDFEEDETDAAVQMVEDGDGNQFFTPVPTAGIGLRRLISNPAPKGDWDKIGKINGSASSPTFKNVDLPIVAQEWMLMDIKYQRLNGTVVAYKYIYSRARRDKNGEQLTWTQIGVETGAVYKLANINPTFP